MQAYVRLPAAMPADKMVVEAKPLKRVKMKLGMRNKPAVASEQVAQMVELQSSKAQEWCGAQYRSYTPTDNTYQPYGSGPRRTCVAPVIVTVPIVEQVAIVDSANEADANTRWCMERYSSYRIEDNTYQPFSGGRKKCPGLGSQSASNDVRTADSARIVQF